MSNAAAQPTRAPELLTVIVPCLDEEDTIKGTIEEIFAAEPDLPVQIEVLLVDDGSRDQTARRMEELCERFERCRMRRNERNLGVGRSVLEAYEVIAEGSWVSVLPGDGELVFSSIANLLAVRDRYDLVLGYLQNEVIRTFRRRLASRLFTLTASALYGLRFRYLNGMKLYRVEVFRGIELVSGGHALNPELIAKALLRKPDLKIGEAPFLARGRSHGSSKAIRPGSILRAVLEVVAGYRAVSRYRNEIIKSASS